MINTLIFCIEQVQIFIAALDWWLWHKGFVND
jgi:hypothetical protein